MELDPGETENFLDNVLTKFENRHRNFTSTLTNHFNNVKHLMPKSNETKIPSNHKKLLIGAYFTMEYSMESTALTNPSIIDAPDQQGLLQGQTRVIISFRSIGEGHISSIVFRTGIIDVEGNFEFMPSGDRVEQAAIVKHHTYKKKCFTAELKEAPVSKELTLVMNDLGSEFMYGDLKQAVDRTIENNNLSMEKQRDLREIMWLADYHYETHFSVETDISERVIFPVSDEERNGMEDARFVKFTDNGRSTYFATYTAYDGHEILPKLLETQDFKSFKVRPMHGIGAKNKNMALFPRKINGQYAMLSRIDAINNYISFSDNLTIWGDPTMVQTPKYPWEFVQIGNCGSPMETDKGWLIITHGVGPLRTYCLGASLFDLKDPTQQLGRLKEPLMVPREDEREGYVPNVVYSCGSMICHDQVIIPYGISDYGSGIVTVPLDELLDKIMNA